MEFAENGRISHRQLYRQMILTLLAPFLLCLFGRDKIWGLGGVFGTVFALIVLLFYVIFIIRLAPCYGDTVEVDFSDCTAGMLRGNSSRDAEKRADG